jgi:hypothetical protein
VDMILLDWTRMGKTYCIAGAVLENGRYRVVRPLLAKNRAAPVRNVGWSSYLLDGHARWEVFELIGPEPAEPQAPHLEDLWVRSLQPRRRLATPDERRNVLRATLVQLDAPIFGTPLSTTRAAAFVQPGTGERSLATVLVPAKQLSFSGCRRAGVLEADFRVILPIPGMGERSLPVKDHFLLRRAEAGKQLLEEQIGVLTSSIRQMGEQIAIRLGLSRGFQGTEGNALCWLMADGFFSLEDPQP